MKWKKIYPNSHWLRLASSLVMLRSPHPSTTGYYILGRYNRKSTVYSQVHSKVFQYQTIAFHCVRGDNRISAHFRIDRDFRKTVYDIELDYCILLTHSSKMSRHFETSRYYICHKFRTLCRYKL